MIEGIKLYCKEQIKIIDSQIKHSRKVDELFKHNYIKLFMKKHVNLSK